MASGWLVGRPRGTCSVTGRTIAPDEAYFAALREGDTGLERIEFTMEAWADLDDAERRRLLAFWKTRLPRPDEDRRKLRIDDEVLIELLRRLEDAADPQKLAFRFMLALMLMRKRRLAYEGTSHDDAGRDVWRLRLKNAQAHRPPADAEEFSVIDPKLDESQLEEVGQQVGQLLAGEEDATGEG